MLLHWLKSMLAIIDLSHGREQYRLVYLGLILAVFTIFNWNQNWFYFKNIENYCFKSNISLFFDQKYLSLNFNGFTPFWIDTYCWIHTTFSIENAWKKRVGDEVPYPGVDKTTPNEKKVYHAYYQWVCFVLFFQALLFYVPRYFWKAFEGGRMKGLIMGLNSPICSEDTKTQNRALLVEYLHRNLNNHNTLFIIYTIAEVLNLLNVILQMVIMDRFLGGEFTNYGWEVINFSEWDWSVRYDPMVRIITRLFSII